MDRRTMLRLLAGVPLVALSRPSAGKVKGAPLVVVNELQRDWRLLLRKNADVATDVTPLNVSEEEWRRRLTPAAFNVLREDGTERAYTSPLDKEKRPGVYACAGCSLPLFSSAMKYDSGTGWPSFFTVIPGAVATRTDRALLMPRTEYHCAKCGGHHGHIFSDGPPPTGTRYCNNGVALRFIPLQV